jgi:lipopolysaccharide transport system ATP-binding protein
VIVPEANAVEVSRVSKYYSLGNSQWSRLTRMFAPRDLRRGPEICALQDVSFSVAYGEAFGIIGSNGSGKSTLLQIIAGILQPTSGSVQMNGRCSALLELGSGFASEFTGRQNVYLNATLLGLSREETDARFDTIQSFAGIGEFIDQPIRTYSTGMVLRLAFAVAAHTDPRIIIVDEALAVGDIAFRQRCMRRVHELRAQGVTILFVSHDTGDVKALCERCLWLEKGVVRAIGEADAVVARYLAATLDRQPPQTAPDQNADAGMLRPTTALMPEPQRGRHRYGNGAAVVADVSVPRSFDRQDALLRVNIRGIRAVASPIAGFLVRNQKGETIFGTNSARENHPLPTLGPGDEYIVDFHLAMPQLAPGEYSISAAISDGSLGDFEVCDYIEDALSFHQSPGVRSISGYMEIPCRAVAIHRS